MLPTTYLELALRRQFIKRIEAELSKGSFTNRGLQLKASSGYNGTLYCNAKTISYNCLCKRAFNNLL